ncbi:MAG: NADH-quinone oxidoreductase subunit N [Chthonomonadales bacterium]|nr:NADH-quinone oxidoreductase subunit N [Chthonomonadales bacterium]
MGAPTQAIRDLSGILPILVLWGVALVILLGAPLLRRGPGSRLAAPLGGAGALGALLVLLRGSSDGFGDTLFAGAALTDTLYSSGAFVLLLGGFLSVLVAQTYLRSRDLEKPEYYAIMLLSLSGALLMMQANDLIVLFLGLELMSFGLYVLAGFARTDAKSDEAALKYFLLGALASALMLYGIMLTYGVAASTELSNVQSAVARGALKEPMGIAAALLLVIGLCFKIAAVPFHQWSPDVYEGAPTSATAFLATTAKIGAIVAFLRVCDTIAGGYHTWLPAIRAIAILSMIVGNLIAIAQTNVKRMLAYSGVAHAGYLLVAVACMGFRLMGTKGTQASILAMTGAVFYLLAYALALIGAFGVLAYLSSRDKDAQTLNDLRGLASSQPAVGYAMVLFMLSLAGIPATAGFIGKWQVFYAVLTGGDVALAVTMALTSAMGVYYYLRVVWYIVFEESAAPKPSPTGHGVEARPRAMTGVGAAITICCIATIGLGILPAAISSFLTVVR